MFGGIGGSPFQIAFTTLPRTQSQYAYVAAGSDVYYCLVNSNGTFNTCTAATNIPSSGAGHDIEGISIATSPSGIQYAYLADQNNGVYQCTIGNTADFSSTCVLTTDSPASDVPTMQTITFAKVNGVQYAYMGNGGAGTTYSCPFNTSTGALISGCLKEPATTQSWNPYGINTVITNGGKQFVYVASQGPSTGVNSIQVNTDGTLSTTISTTGGITWGSPNAIASAYTPAS